METSSVRMPMCILQDDRSNELPPTIESLTTDFHIKEMKKKKTACKGIRIQRVRQLLLSTFNFRRRHQKAERKKKTNIQRNFQRHGHSYFISLNISHKFISNS